MVETIARKIMGRLMNLRILIKISESNWLKLEIRGVGKSPAKMPNPRANKTAKLKKVVFFMGRSLAEKKGELKWLS